jgi:copper chaperone NosL
MKRRWLGLSAALLLAMSWPGVPMRAAGAAMQGLTPKPVQPTAEDRCPVCGMFVAKHKDFLAEFVFRDGTYAIFDGAKDMFRGYFDMAASLPGKSRADIAAIYVTDYYSLKWIDGTRALYVSGSDILGPMGAELIPLAGDADAQNFSADHKGRSILKFADVTPQLLRDLD